MKQYPPVRVVALAALVLSFAGTASCAEQAHTRVAFASSAAIDADATPALAAPAARARSVNDNRIVLVTIDGVRAEDVFEGADPTLRPGANVEHLRRPEAVMPRTTKLIARGGVALGAERAGCGAVRTASGANVSLPGYLEIFTGRKTRCRDNQCARTLLPTVLDEVADIGASLVASIGSWDVLDRAVTRGSSNVLVAEGRQAWPGPRPLVAGRMDELVAAGETADAYPGVGRYRPDAFTGAIALEYLRTAAPKVLHVGFGDADEWGHRNDYPAYLGAIGKADAFIGEVADTLEAMGEAGARTTVIVTTDHGRNRDFQHHGALSATSGRTFVLAFGGRVPARGVVCPAHDVTLADVAPTMRVILGLPADTSPDAGRPIDEIVETVPVAVAAMSAGAARRAQRVQGMKRTQEARHLGGGASAAAAVQRP